jgi:hypothetical protein
VEARLSRAQNAAWRSPRRGSPRCGDAAIVFQVIGDRPHDVVFVLDWASHLETLVERPFIAEWFTSA